MREFPHGRAEIVRLGGADIGRLTLEPGWRWSTDVKPIAGTESCQTHHTGICLSGQMTIRFDSGDELTIGPGDVVDLEPGHDAWTVGDEPCIVLDTGIAATTVETTKRLRRHETTSGYS